jgi:hypothetical protein
VSARAHQLNSGFEQTHLSSCEFILVWKIRRCQVCHNTVHPHAPEPRRGVKETAKIGMRHTESSHPGVDLKVIIDN